MKLPAASQSKQFGCAVYVCVGGFIVIDIFLRWRLLLAYVRLKQSM